MNNHTKNRPPRWRWLAAFAALALLSGCASFKLKDPPPGFIEVSSSDYGGEAVPVFQHMWSVGHALLLGCEPQFAPNTVWTEPLPAGADGYPSIRFHREGRGAGRRRAATPGSSRASPSVRRRGARPPC